MLPCNKTAYGEEVRVYDSGRGFMAVVQELGRERTAREKGRLDEGFKPPPALRRLPNSRKEKETLASCVAAQGVTIGTLTQPHYPIGQASRLSLTEPLYKHL